MDADGTRWELGWWFGVDELVRRGITNAICGPFAVEPASLAEGGGESDNGAVGDGEHGSDGVVELVVEGESGGDGALAGLAAAEEEGVPAAAAEKVGLPGIGSETEGAEEGGRINIGDEVVVEIHFSRRWTPMGWEMMDARYAT